MAYMSQEHKKEIAALLKKVIPENWKCSLSVHNHSTIVLTIKSADVDLIKECKNKYSENVDHLSLNHYYLDSAYEGKTLEALENIKEALNHKNHDNSDIQTDYFDVGHYIEIRLGKWDKPFEYKPVEKVLEDSADTQVSKKIKP